MNLPAIMLTGGPMSLGLNGEKKDQSVFGC